MENEKFSVDRIEEGIAVCEREDGTQININIELLPDGVKEGSVVEYCEESESYIINEEAEKKAKDENISLQKRLFGRKKKNND